MKNRRLWILPGAVVVLTAAFLLLNFHVAASDTHAEKNIMTTGTGEGLPSAMQRREKISIALLGEGPLVRALQKALASEMNKVGIGEIELVSGTAPAYPNPVLVIKVSKPGLLWTPFFATSQFSIQAGYTSTGDTMLISDTPVTVDNTNGPVLSMVAEYKVNDRSWGLFSRPGYHQILADVVAQNIVAALKDLYKVGS